MKAIRHRLAILAAVGAFVLAGVAAGCGDDDNESASEEAGQAVEDVGQAAEDVGQAGEDAGQAVEGADKDVGGEE
jgi:hypothetical protein